MNLFRATTDFRSVTALRINIRFAVSYSQSYLSLLWVTSLAELKRGELEPAAGNLPPDCISKAWCLCIGGKVTCLLLFSTRHQRRISHQTYPKTHLLKGYSSQKHIWKEIWTLDLLLLTDFLLHSITPTHWWHKSTFIPFHIAVEVVY